MQSHAAAPSQGLFNEQDLWSIEERYRAASWAQTADNSSLLVRGTEGSKCHQSKLLVSLLGKPYLPKLQTTHNLKQLKYSHAALLNQ